MDVTFAANEAVGQDMLAPQLAGARARGLADAFSLLGLPAILLDREGRALHVSREAALLMGASLAIDSSHVTAADELADRALQAAIARALAERHGPATPIPDSSAREAPDSMINVHALPVPGGSEDRFQLLGCVLILERAGCEAATGLAHAALRSIGGGRRGISPTH